MGDHKQFLAGAPLFTGLADGALDRLARVSYLKRVPKDRVIFEQGERGEAAYVVRAGVIDIVLITPDGRELVINQMKSGDCFGDLALMDGQPRSASAVAHEPSELIVIPSAAFMAEVEQNPVVMRRLLTTVAGRLRSSSERESALAFLDAHARLASVLLEAGRDQHSGGLVTMSQDELADHVGVARQTVAKILGQWRRAGWILTGRGKIMLLDRAALRRSAHKVPTP